LSIKKLLDESFCTVILQAQLKKVREPKLETALSQLTGPKGLSPALCYPSQLEPDLIPLL
jgi:hypothetical protein